MKYLDSGSMFFGYGSKKYQQNWSRMFGDEKDKEEDHKEEKEEKEEKDKKDGRFD